MFLPIARRLNRKAARSAKVTGAKMRAKFKLPAQAELNNAQTNSTDWLVSNHDYGGQRFVDLKQINPQNVASLRPACLFH